MPTRDQWKQNTKIAVQQSDNQTSLTPTKGKPEEEERLQVSSK